MSPASPSKTRPIRRDLVQGLVLEVYAAVREEGQLADRVLDRVLRRESRLYSAERRAVSESVYGMLRTERRLDHALFGGRPPAVRGMALHVLRYAAHQVAEGDDARAVAVALGLDAKALAQLESVKKPLPEPLSARERIELEGSLPRFVAELLMKDLGEADALAFARAVGVRAPLTLRANTLRATREALASRIQGEGAETEPTRYSPLGLTLRSRVNAFGLSAFRDGLFEVQDEGSQLLALAVQAEAGEKVVDACAGAGGKTLALAAAMQNRGEVWALDVDAPRLSELSRRARRAGVSNVRVLAIPADASAEKALAPLKGKADRVLIDAPCTGLGVLRRNPDSRYRLKPEDFERYPARQSELLERFATLAKPAGRVVYATCSVARAENENVVEAFLRTRQGFELEEASKALPGLPSELFQGPYLRLYPHRHGTDGFFAAVLKKSCA